MSDASTGRNLIDLFAAAGGIGGVTAYLRYRVAGKEARTSAQMAAIDTASSLTATSLSLLEPVKAAAAKAEERVAVLQGQIGELEAVVVSLSESLSKLNVQASDERDEFAARLTSTRTERDAEIHGLRMQLVARDAEIAVYRARGGAP